MFVKICGLCSGADVQAVAALEPDALGFVFWSGSKRCVRPADVASWTRDLPPGLLKVGVFVDAALGEVENTVRAAGLDVVQWHGFPMTGNAVKPMETPRPRGAEALRAEGGPSPAQMLESVRVWRVVHLDRGGPPPEEAAFVDAFLVDSYSADSPGGTGRVGNWAAAREFVARCEKPVVLAGGLTPENVAEAIRTVRPWGVDVSSGVELSPGRKDLQKVERFIRACRENA